MNTSTYAAAPTANSPYACGHATTPAGGESGGRPHGPTRGGEEPDRVSTVANDP